MSSSSSNFPSHPYHRQSRSPSYQSSSSHPTQSAAAVESSLAPQDLSQNLAVPGRGVANPADSTPSPVPRLTGGDLGDLTQGSRSGVRGARSYSSPPLAIGLNTGLSDSSFSPGPVYPASTLGAQSTSELSYQNRGRLSATDLRVPGYSLPQRPGEIGSEAYLPGNMAPEAPSWSWQGRPSHSPLQSSSMGYDQQLQSSESLSPESFPLGYNVPQGSPRGYYQPGGLPSPYLSVPSAGPSQAASHPRSVSMSYALPGSTVSGNVPHMSNQSYMPHSPSYFPSHSDYFLPETSVPSHSPSIPVSSPQPPPGPPIYSSPDPGSASASTSTDPDGQVRVLSFRPKPQCWDHGCNGREFSTFSNLLRHQREKSGVVAKAECPVCGAAFTRTTARNIHVAQGKCKGGRESSAG